MVEVRGVPLIYRTSKVLNLKGGNAYEGFRAFDRSQLHDVVIIGSSHAYRGYDTQVLGANGYTAYNLGSSAQTPLNTEAIISDLLTKENTGLLLLDVYRGAFETDGLESTADLIQNYPSQHAVNKMAWNLKDPRVLNMLALRSFMSETPIMYTEACHGQNGTCLISDSLTAMLPEGGMKKPIVASQWARLGKIVNELKGAGIPVVLVDHPIPSFAEQEAHLKHHQMVQVFAEENGLRYFYNEGQEQLDDLDHFYDRSHLNAAGARLFTHALLVRLKNEGLLRAPGL